MRNVLLLCLVAVRGFAGQSLVLTPGVRSTGMNDPNLPAQQAWRVEFQLHGWAPPSAATSDGFVWALNGIGASASVVPSNELWVTDTRDSVAGGSPCHLPLAGRTDIVVRVQREPQGGQARFVCEMWNIDGTGYVQTVLTILSPLAWTYSGGGFGSAFTTAQLGFFRVFLTTLPDGSRPPVTADKGDWTDLEFDGNLKDSSGNGHDVTFDGAAYSSTPDQNPTSFVKTLSAPSWSNWVSLRAGYPATLDGTSSFSMSDGTSAVSYSWQQISGPTNVIWSDRTAAQPMIKGLIFGTYVFGLTVTDPTGNSNTMNLSVGAVATDDNGVVIQGNPAADAIFGPMIAFGKNPWPWEDQMTLHAAQVRKPEIAAISPPAWSSTLAGTISYLPGAASQASQTALSTAISSTDTTITVNDASKLDFATLPALIMIHAPSAWAPIEEVQICAANGNTLTVCYDGRAWHAGSFERVASAQNWMAGVTVRQVETLGTGTTFLTDFCAAGAGEPGQVTYSTGMVTPAPGQAALTGVGTAWDNTLSSQRIRIQGTHGGGTPFVFFAGVSSVANGLSLVMTRPWPSDADAGTFSYAVINNARIMARNWKRADGTTGQQTTNIAACESDTQMYMADIFSNVSGAQTNQQYSYSTGGWLSQYGPNYYDEVLAHYAGYFRSGYDLFLNNARGIGDYWATQPDLDQGYQSTVPRYTSVTGMVAAAVLDGRTSNWYTIRNLAQAAVTNPYLGPSLAPCGQDLRETSYELSWIALAAQFDPLDTGNPKDLNQRSYWKAQLDAAYTRDNGCKSPASSAAFDPSYDSANSFPSSFWVGSGSYTMTNGSATVTGNGIPATTCNSSPQGSITVTLGSTIATGAGFTPNAKIVVIGKRVGQPYLFYSLYTVNSPMSITLASPFDGDSGTYSYQIESDTSWLSFGVDPNDLANINTLYACQWVNASTITLDRPWSGKSGTYGSYRYIELGYGTQPFMAGIKAMATRWASLGASGQTASNYAALSNQIATWVLSTGFDTGTKGLHYGRGWAGCEPLNHPRMNCTYATDTSSRQSARFLNGEAQNAMGLAYQANPDQQTKDFGDQFYGGQWGKLGGPWSDDVYLSNIESDSTWSYKWLGFLFGIGMAHQWPAVRLGGVQPAVMVTSSVPFDMGTVAGAVSVNVIVTQPSSAQTTFPCSTSPCTVNLDKRQGAHWYQIQYLDAGGKVLSQTDPHLLELQ
jgi:hypothetical protein